MSGTKWIIGIALVGAAALQLTLLATGAAGRPGTPDAPGRPGREPASIQLTPDPLAIPCDGAATSTVTVRITDAQGRAVPDGTLVYFDARYGFVDPVEAETKRGEATTQAGLYPYAANFPDDTDVQVAVEGLRASIGIGCVAAPPTSCHPASPPQHPMSPPCPTPVSPPPCNDTQSPPVSFSPPCVTATPTPLPCPAFSPPCGTPPDTGACDPVFSPPCVTPTPCAGDGCPNEIRLDANTSEPGTQFSWSYPVGSSFRMGIDLTQFAGVPYHAYQWAFEWPTAGLAFGSDIIENGPSVGLDICVEAPRDAVIDPAYDDARVGGCIASDPGLTTSMTGQLTTFTMTCTSPGYFKVNMIDGAVAQTLETKLIAANAEDLPTVTEGALIECYSSPPSYFPCDAPIVSQNPLYNMYVRATESAGVITVLVGVDNLGGGPYQGLQWEVCYNSGDAHYLRAVRAPQAPDQCNLKADNGTRTLLACLDTSGPFIDYSGDAWIVTYSCNYPGPVEFRLGIDTFLSAEGPDYEPITTTDASVECTTGTSTFTRTPIPPSPTPTATPTATPTPGNISGCIELPSTATLTPTGRGCLELPSITPTPTPTSADLIPIFIPLTSAATPTPKALGSRRALD